MRKLILIAIVMNATSQLVACSSKGMYEAIQNNQCLERTGEVYCDERQDYETYKREREAIIQEKK